MIRGAGPIGSGPIAIDPFLNLILISNELGLPPSCASSPRTLAAGLSSCSGNAPDACAITNISFQVLGLYGDLSGRDAGRVDGQRASGEQAQLSPLDFCQLQVNLAGLRALLLKRHTIPRPIKPHGHIHFQGLKIGRQSIG